jgi:tetratricopeptide (TPR) repeat protein
MEANLRLLFGLLWQPMTALRRLRERSPVAFAVGAAWLMTFLYAIIAKSLSEYAQEGAWRAGMSPFSADGAGVWLLSGAMTSAAMAAVMFVLFVAVIYVPFAIFIANLFERRASFSLVIREEYAPVVACALLSLAVSLLVTLLPALLIGWQSARLNSATVTPYIILLFVMPLPIFAALMALTIGVSFHIGWAAAAVTTLISFLSLLGITFFMQAATFICASPFLLILLLFLLRDRIDDFFGSQRSRQAFKQNLEAATLNPADASAHYNLGLIYQQRGEFDAATAAFKRAVEIDPREVDAHYQMGRIAREQGRLNEAIQSFERVVQLEPAHSQHEIWRETALVYYAAGQYRDALDMLERFLNERPSDAQARYWHGMTLDSLGRENEAIQEMQNCVETVRTAPAYKYRTDRKWLYLAQNFLKERR